MLSLRKTLLAGTFLALASGSLSAQVINPLTPLNCVAQSAGTPAIRAEGVAELVGDVLIICNGGTPTAANRNLPQFNLQIFSSPSINITSRILSGGAPNAFTEALLFIDEPSPAKQTICGSTSYPVSIPAGTGGTQQLIAGVCARISGAPLGNGIGTYDPDVAAGTITVDSQGNLLPVSETSWRGNAYQARTAGNNSLIWQGIPFDSPGTLTTRIMRITNVRVNASQLGVPAGSTASVNLVISTSASGVSNPIAVPITNPAPTVAIAQPSLDFSFSETRSCLQCESANFDFAEPDLDDPLNSRGDVATDCDNVLTVIRFQERFPTVFRRRNVNRGPNFSFEAPITTPQDELGVIYQTESGFHKISALASRWPAQLANTNNTSIIAGPTTGTLGLADHGTRLIVRFNNVQNGLTMWVPVAVGVFNRQTGGGGTQTGFARLVVTDPNGAGPFSPANATANPGGGEPTLAQVSVVGGSGQLVYQITDTDTTAIERLEIPLILAYRSNTSAGLPSLGTAAGNGSLAPLSTIATATGTSGPLPRFVDTSANRNFLTINSCRTNLLFPFVSNQGGFDTGLAIANTSKDPFGTSVQTGACTVNFYGKVGNSNVCLSFPSPSITGGEHFVWSLSSGGAVTATAGFQGYVIAQCNFQYGHGFAFISDLGAQRLAMGYLALVMDDHKGSRTGSVSESLGH